MPINFNLLSCLGCKILKNEPLYRHCSFKIGGCADFFIEIPNETALLVSLKNIIETNTRFYILGGGTNVLFSDERYIGVIISLVGKFKEFSVSEENISSGSGVLLSDILKNALENNLTGLEYMAGVPGTVGGAIYGNAGKNDKWVSESVSSIEIYKNFKKELVNKEEIAFEYRKSGLRNCIITKVNFSLKKDIKNANLDIVSSIIKKRLNTQPLDMPNAGCIFKNPDGFIIGKLIEEAGLKGMSIGNAQISELHSNFIVNRGGALAKDVLTLIDFTKKNIKEKFGINLETEIKIIK